MRHALSLEGSSETRVSWIAAIERSELHCHVIEISGVSIQLLVLIQGLVMAKDGGSILTTGQSIRWSEVAAHTRTGGEQRGIHLVRGDGSSERTHEILAACLEMAEGEWKYSHVEWFLLERSTTNRHGPPG